MSSLKEFEFESDCGKNEPCEQGYSWIIKFSFCLNFGYRKYGIIFSIRTQNGCTHCKNEGKNM